MRSFESWIGSLIWVAVAVLMPMAALEPVAAGGADTRIEQAVALCADGAANLAMGCESIHL